MFIFGPPEQDQGLDNAIDVVYRDMNQVSPDSDEYSAMVQQLMKLYTLKQKPWRVSPDTLLAVVGQVSTVILILQHERLHVVTSKALGFVRQLK